MLATRQHMSLMCYSGLRIWSDSLERSKKHPGHVARTGEMCNMYTILIGEHEGRQQRGTWENGIKMDLKEIGCEAVDWIYATLR